MYSIYLNCYNCIYVLTVEQLKLPYGIATRVPDPSPPTVASHNLSVAPYQKCMFTFFVLLICTLL
jgi:hypothetical protein